MDDTNKRKIARLVRQVQNGDQYAFEKLYDATNASGYFTALQIVRDAHEAQDILQESYLTVLKKIGELREPENFTGWFHRIVAGKAKDHLRKRKPSLFETEEAAQNVTELLPETDEEYLPAENADREDIRRRIMAIIDGLSDEKRMCILLYYYNEMHISEIAETVGVSESTVKARLLQARKDIQREVEQQSKKNVALRSAAPIPLLVWAMRATAKTVGSTAASGTAAAVLGKAALSGSTSGSATTGAAGSFGVKAAMLSVTQKVVTGVVAAGIVTGGAAGTAAVVQHVRETPTDETVSICTQTETLTQAISETLYFAEESTAPPETQTDTERIAAVRVKLTVPKSEPTAPKPTQPPRTTRMYTEAPAPTHPVPKPTKSTTTKPTTTKPTTTKPTTSATQPTTTTKPVTTAPPVTTTEPVTTTTTTTVPQTATVTVRYSVADMEDSGTVTFTVPAGSAVTQADIENAVREKLAAVYGDEIEIVLRSGNPVEAAEATGYAFSVLVYAD